MTGILGSRICSGLVAALAAFVMVSGGAARVIGGISHWDETTVCTAGCSGTYTGVYTLSSDTLSGTLASGGQTFVVTTVRSGFSFAMHTTGPGGYSSDAKGTLSADGKSMSGTFSDVSSGSGTWTAVFVSGTPPVSPPPSGTPTVPFPGQVAPEVSGTASCTISATASGYTHSETQSWQVGGSSTTIGDFTQVSSTWTDKGSGSSQTTQGTQTTKTTWVTDATAGGLFQSEIRASDGQLVISQESDPKHVTNGTTGTQQTTVGGVAQPPKPVSAEAVETTLPEIAGSPTSSSITGSTPPTPETVSVGPFQPAGAVVTKACKWDFKLSPGPLPPPVRGVSMDAQYVDGTVLVNGATLTLGASVPVGAVIDATKGTMVLTSVNGTGNFYGGAFRAVESRAAGAPTELQLQLGSTAACAKKHSASAAPKPKVLDSLWGNAKGTFVTKGRYASAAVRGTLWHTVDRCDGTLVAVSRGIVAVRDLKRGTTTLVPAGKQLLVKP